MNNISDKIKSSAEKVDNFLKKYFLKKNTQNSLFEAMNYGLFSGGNTSGGGTSLTAATEEWNAGKTVKTVDTD